MKTIIYLPSTIVEYQIFGIGFIICVLIALIVTGLSKVLSENRIDVEKYAAYECGFDPFGDARHTFSIKFYLVAILFVIFDLEVIFLFPWSVTLNCYQALYSMIAFLIILTIGFLYEWTQGALDW